MIHTFENHFKAGLATVDKKFPISEWDRLVEQAVLTLNLLRTSRVNPKLSAWAYLFGMFDFNKCPLAPPGTKVVLHEKPSNRASWAYHGTDGWYIGPSLEHYRCVKIYVPETGAVRNADTVKFFPSTIPLPQTSTEDYLKQASSDILSLLKITLKHSHTYKLEVLQKMQSRKLHASSIEQNHDLTVKLLKQSILHQKRGCKRRIIKIVRTKLR